MKTVDERSAGESPAAGERQNQADRAFAELRRSILSGALPPGVKLKIESLQRQFGLSSSPLREALNRLSVEGLVVTEENRGFRAAPITAGDLQDLTRLRVAVEIQALKESVRHGDETWKADLVTAHDQFAAHDRSVAEGNVSPDAEWTRLHKAFHVALISGCPYPRMTALCASLFDQSERYRRLSARFRSVPRGASDEHLRLLDAVTARKADMAALLLIEHIEDTSRNVLHVLSGVPLAFEGLDGSSSNVNSTGARR
jgi:GntR family carbon starvation induced transcriptional regulator